MGKRTDATDFWSLCFDLHTAHHVDVTKLEVVSPQSVVRVVTQRSSPRKERCVTTLITAVKESKLKGKSFYLQTLIKLVQGYTLNCVVIPYLITYFQRPPPGH